VLCCVVLCCVVLCCVVLCCVVLCCVVLCCVVLRLAKDRHHGENFFCVAVGETGRECWYVH
jgi:hypothetical protein